MINRSSPTFWRNWAHLAEPPGRPGHGGGEGAGEAGLGQAPGHAGRGADDQQDQTEQILAVDGGFSAAGLLPAYP
jgi:hypothetical protein